MSEKNYVGTAKLRVNMMRNGELLLCGDECECTQEELDGNYFDQSTFKKSENATKKIEASPQNKSMSSKNTKAKKTKESDK